jgi:hypothetical protein
MYKEFSEELSPESKDIVNTLRDFGFYQPHFAMKTSTALNTIYTISRVSFYDDKTKYHPVLHLEPRTNLFWFPKFTRAIIFALADNLPKWAANDLERDFTPWGSQTGKDNKNSIPFSYLDTILHAVFQQIKEDCKKYNGEDIPEYMQADALAANQKFPITHKTSSEITIANYMNFLKYIEAGIDFEASLIFSESNISYEKLVASEFYDPDLPIELVMSLLD